MERGVINTYKTSVASGESCLAFVPAPLSPDRKLRQKRGARSRALKNMRARARVERLEDRILLSAQPLLQAVPAEEGGPLQLVLAEQARLLPQSSLDSYAGFATFIDLGQSATQNPALSADAADPSLLRLNDELTALVIDLGSGDNAAVLSSAGDGKLRLSGASFNDLVFARPTILLGIRGGGGIDSLAIESLEVSSLVVEAERISLGAGQTLLATDEVTLRASSAAAQSQGSKARVDLLARVGIDGEIRAGGQLTFDASVITDVVLSPKDALIQASIDASTTAEALIGGQSRIAASGLSLTAHTYGQLQINAAGAASGSVLIDARQSTRAGIAAGATLALSGSSSPGQADLLVEAVDQSRVATSLNTSDALIIELTGFDLGLGQINLERNTLAFLGQTDGGSGPRLSLAGQDGGAAGLVQVSAASLDAADGGILGQVVSSLVGVQRNVVKDQVQALVGQADLALSGLQVYALNASSLGAEAKVASNQASGVTRALVANSVISAAGDLRLLVTDLARFEANSDGFSANPGLLKSISVGIATASHQIDRSLQARLSDSTVQAGAVLVMAKSAASIAAKADAMALTGGPLAPGYKLAMGGSFAWNQVLGQVEASVQRSSLNAEGLGGVVVQARNTSAVSAHSVAVSVAPGGAALGASLAFNAMGWRMGDLGVGALTSLIGSDLGSTELPMQTLALVSDSSISKAGAVAVTALNAVELDALILSRADASSALGGLAMGAAAVLASNRVRSDTRASVVRDGVASAVLSSAGPVTVAASDDAGIQAKVRMDATAGAVGASAAVGGIVVRNDVRGAVRADVDAMALSAGGDVQVQALESARIEALLSGTVQAGADSGFASRVLGSGPSLAANALIASNLVLSDAQAQVRDTMLIAGGDVDVSSRNSSAIEAHNRAITESGSIAAGLTLAFNTLGWRAQNLLSAGVDALLGTQLGEQAPASVSATVFGGSLRAGGDLSITADADEQVSATIDNAVSASGAGASASLVLASNLISATSLATLATLPAAAAGATLSVAAGGEVIVSAADRAAVEADVRMGSGSAGGVAVGGVVVRNDVRSAVDAHIDRVDLSAGSDLSVLALGAAEIGAALSGETVSEAAESDTQDSETGSSLSLALNALIANNLVLSSVQASVSDSDLTVAGDLTVAADDAARIAADNRATLTSDGLAVGLTLAFNTIGWQAQNLLFNAVDALIGTDIGIEQAATASATVLNTALAVGGDLQVSAGAQAAEAGVPHGARLSATIANEVTANSENAAVSLLLASNRVSSKALAWVSPLASREAVASPVVGPQAAMAVDGSVRVEAVDQASIVADVSLSASSSGGPAVGGVVVRNDVRAAVSSGLDRVDLDAGGDVSIIALESAQITAGLSGKARTAAEPPPEDAEEPAAGGADSTGSTGGTPNQAAGASKTMPPMAVNGLIANNLVLSTSLASLTHSEVLAGGSLTLQAHNDAGIEASNRAVIESGGVAVGVTLAFNTLGWQPQNVFSKAIDGLLGTSLGTEWPVSAKAWVDNSAVSVGADLTVDAAVEAVISASTSNEASSVGASAAASLVLATNFVSSWADAFIVMPADSSLKTLAGGALSVTASDAPSVEADTTIVAASTAGAQPGEPDEYSRVDFSSEDGEQTVKFGSQVMLAPDHEAGGTGGRIYRYMGGTTELINLSTTDYTDAGYWYELVPAEGKAGELLDLVEKAKSIVDEVKSIVNGDTDTEPQAPPDTSHDWAVLSPSSASLAQSESQTLTLPTTMQAGQMFSLALGSTKTDPIEALVLGQPIQELQRLTVLAGPQAAGQTYTLSMGQGRSATLVFAGVADTDAARIQAVVEDWVGIGKVQVSFDPTSRAGWSFDIRFMMAGNQAQLVASASGAAAALLSFNSRTEIEGGSGATVEDQEALIDEALETALGQGAVHVVWQSSAAGGQVYRIDFVGDDLAGRDLPALRAVEKSAGLTASVGTLVQGALARDRFVLERYDPAGTGTFDLEITLDGVAYLATNISDKATDAAVAEAILSALSPEDQSLADTGLEVSVVLTVQDDGSKAWEVTLQGGPPGRKVEAFKARTSLPEEGAGEDELEGGEPTSRAMAVGGVVVRNDVRGQAYAYLLRTGVDAGSVRVDANDEAVILAKLDSTAIATGGDGAGLAFGGVIATNLVLSKVEAYISDSSIKTREGGVEVLGLNDSHIVARNQSAMESDGASVGVTLAFNTVGWQAQNLLFATVDALVGTSIGNEQPSRVLAYISRSDIDAEGEVSVDAQSQAYIHADILNETSSMLAAAGGDEESANGDLESADGTGSPGGTGGTTAGGTGTGASGGTGSGAAPGGVAAEPSGLSVGFVLASNLVSSQARAWIDGPERRVSTQDGAMSVRAQDDASIESTVELSSVAAAGEESEASLALQALVNYFGLNYTDRSGTQSLKTGDRVRLADASYGQFDRPRQLLAGDRVALTTSVGGGAAGQVFEYIGQEPLEGAALDAQNYRDATLWRAIKGQAGKTYLFIGGGGVRDLALEDYSNTSRWLLVDVGKLADLGLAVAGALGGGGGGASAFGGLVVRNDVRSDVAAWVDGQSLTIAGDVSISAIESAVILSEDNSTVSADTVGLNVVIATNTVLSSARAWAKDSDIRSTVGGEVSITADNRSQISAHIKSSVQASTSVGVVLAFNTIGFAPQNLLSNAIDGLLGTGIGGQTPARTEAWIDNTRIRADGDVRLSATADGVIDAVVENSAVAVSLDTAKAKPGEDDSQAKLATITIAPVLAMNKISADVLAHVDRPVGIEALGDVSVQASGANTVHAQVQASAVSIAAGAKGSTRSVSVGLSLSRNMVRSDVDAWMLGQAGAGAPAEVSAQGDIVVSTARRASIVADGSASAVAIAASPKGGPAVAGGARWPST